jgi:hypothetical protein
MIWSSVTYSSFTAKKALQAEQKKIMVLESGFTWGCGIAASRTAVAGEDAAGCGCRRARWCTYLPFRTLSAGSASKRYLSRNCSQVMVWSSSNRLRGANATSKSVRMRYPQGVHCPMMERREILQCVSRGVCNYYYISLVKIRCCVQVCKQGVLRCMRRIEDKTKRGSHGMLHVFQPNNIPDLDQRFPLGEFLCLCE